jgi:predicted ArsR family transcriptional regulator
MFKKQLLDSTRGRIVNVLRGGPSTADNLAATLGITRSAVRAQLTAMERDGLIHLSGRRPGATRPAHVYALTPETEQLLSRAYLPVLTELVDVATELLTPSQMESMLRLVGQRIGNQLTGERKPSGGLDTRVALVSQLLNDQLGALTRVEKNGSIVIRGRGCPLAALTGKHPGVCLAMESLIAELIGGEVVVREHCDRSDRPQCGFEIRDV